MVAEVIEVEEVDVPVPDEVSVSELDMPEAEYVEPRDLITVG